MAYIGSQEWFHSNKEKEDPRELDQYLRFRHTRKKPGSDRRTKAVYFCPFAPFVALSTALMKEGEVLGLKKLITIVQYMGRPVSQNLVNKHLWNEHFRRENCFPCRKTPKKSIKQEVVYLMEYQNC